jgi:ligand-binding sensor domain-containing protein
MKTFLLFAAMALTISIASGQEYLNNFSNTQDSSWQVYNTENSNLPANWVRGLAIDDSSNIWIGTFQGGGGGGLAKFDGNNWTVFNTLNSGLPEDRIMSLVIDKNDHKWIGTWGGGLIKYDGENWEIFNALNSGLPEDWVYSITIDNNDAIWIGTSEGLAKYDGANWASWVPSNSILPYDYNYITALASDHSGIIWVGTYSGGLVRIDGEVWTVFNSYNSVIPHNQINAITVDGNGTKWFGTNAGLVKHDNSDWTIYNAQNTGLPYMDVVMAVASENTNVLWISTYNNLVKFDGENWTYFDYIGGASAILCDSKGTKWLGTVAGLFVYNENGIPFSISDKTMEDFYLKVFPNPASNHITLQLPVGQQNGIIELFDVKGNIVLRKTTTGNDQIQVDFLNTGIYFYQVTTKDERFTGKLIKQ